MDTASLVTATVLWLSVLVAQCWQSFALQRQLRALQHSQRMLETALQQYTTALKPPPAAGMGFVLSDAETAMRERQLLATSRSRARVLAQDAHQRLTRTFRRGSSR